MTTDSGHEDFTIRDPGTGEPIDFSVKKKSGDMPPKTDGESELAKHFRELSDKLGEKLDTLAPKPRPQLDDQALEAKIREMLSLDETETLKKPGPSFTQEQGMQHEALFTDPTQEVRKIQDPKKRAQVRAMAEARIRLRQFYVDGAFSTTLAQRGIEAVREIPVKPTEGDFQALVDDEMMPGVAETLRRYEHYASQMQQDDLALKAAEPELQYKYPKPEYWNGNRQKGIKGLRQTVREEIGTYLESNYGPEWVKYAEDHERIGYELFEVWFRKAHFGRHCVEPSEPGGKIIRDGFLIAAKKQPGLSKDLLRRLEGTRYAVTGATDYFVSGARQFIWYENPADVEALGLGLFRDVDVVQEKQPPGTPTKEVLDRIIDRRMVQSLENVKFEKMDFSVLPYEGYLKGMASADGYRSRALAILAEGKVEDKIKAVGEIGGYVGHFLPAEQDLARRFWLRMARKSFSDKASALKGGKGAVADLCDFLKGGGFGGELFSTYLSCMKDEAGKPKFSTTVEFPIADPLTLKSGAVEVLNLLGGGVRLEGRGREISGKALVEAYLNKSEDGEWAAKKGRFIAFEDLCAFAGVIWEEGHLRLARPYSPKLGDWNEVFSDGTTFFPDTDRHGMHLHLDDNKRALIEAVLLSRLGDPSRPNSGCTKLKGIPDIHEHILGQAAKLYLDVQHVYAGQICDALRNYYQITECVVPQLAELDDDRPEHLKLENLERQPLDVVELRNKIMARLPSRDTFGSDDDYEEAINAEYRRLDDNDKMEDRPKFDESAFGSPREYHEAIFKARKLNEERQQERGRGLAEEAVDPMISLLQSHWREWGKDASAHIEQLRLYLDPGLLIRERLAENEPELAEVFATSSVSWKKQLTPEDIRTFLRDLANNPQKNSAGVEKPLFKSAKEREEVERLFFADEKNVNYHRFMRGIVGVKDEKSKDQPGIGKVVEKTAGRLKGGLFSIPMEIIMASKPNSVLELGTKAVAAWYVGAPLASAIVGPETFLVGGIASVVGGLIGWAFLGKDWSYGNKDGGFGDILPVAWPRRLLRSKLAGRLNLMGIRLRVSDYPEDPGKVSTDFLKEKVAPYL